MASLFFKYRRKGLLVLAILAALLPSVLEASSSSSSSNGNNEPDENAVKNAVEVTTEAEPEVTSKCPNFCGNGACDERTGLCVCNPGWRGDECHLCGGKIKLNGTEGWLADAFGNYTVDSKCTWLIEAPSKASTIRLHLKEFATECGWDHLYIFDGNSVFSDLRAVYSGMVQQERYRVQKVPELVGRSGSMLLHFYSDVAYNMTGFNITFSVDACPTENTELTCSGHGTCDPSSGNCSCDQDFKGAACSAPACPGNCGNGGTGACNKKEKRCECFPGYTGDSCSQSVGDGFWRILSADDADSVLPAARTSHSAMVDEFGKMWVVGGEMFSRRRTRHMVATWEGAGDLSLGGATASNGFWKEVHANSDKGPSARYGHSAVIHERKIYMYGGTMRSGHTSRELWALDLDLLSWDRVDVNSGQCLSNGDRKLCGPLHSMGHSANVRSSRMIVIFGHSPKYGYLNTVQEYHFGNKQWSIMPTSGYAVRGGFGHSSVWDEINQRVYVYGGYKSTQSTSTSITDELYSLDPIGWKWRRHASSGSFRYLHTAVASHGLMTVFGGNTHNDTSFSHGAKCFSADLIVYDIVCDRWHNVQDSVPKDLNADMARFGHSAVLRNGTMLIHAGFQGVLKNDLLAFVPGQCQKYKSREDCLGRGSRAAGVKCVWNSKKENCERHPAARPQSGGIETCLEDNASRNGTKLCSSLTSCSSCVSTTSECVWCSAQSRCAWRDCANILADAAVPPFVFGRPNAPKGSSPAIQGQSPASAGKDPGRFHRLEECEKAGLESGPREWCEELHTCHSCTAHQGCRWESEKVGKCRQSAKSAAQVAPSAGGSVDEEPGTSPSACTPACSDRPTCGNCTGGLCMWCKNLNMCIDRNAYLASFPYGQCMDWTTKADECPLAPNKNDSKATPDLCVGYNTCDSCRSNPSCGWCDDGSLSGLGVCHLGGAAGPLKRRPLSHANFDYVDDEGSCVEGEGRSWHFTSCPACQCNGHSKCSKKASTCDQPCQNSTEGEHCERCTKGYFGNAVNGGKCQSCQCNGQASTCDHQSGRCHCTTKGIIGDHCEKCDKVNHYYGDPVKESCFYDLAIDYQFTFNLSKSDDKHFTAINFKNEPTKMDVDVEFSISCSVAAKMNISYRYTPANSKVGKEEVLHSGINCTTFKQRFSKDDYIFGESENTTFYVYVYDFEPPLWIIISFSQHPKLDLLQFFITFSTCFIALLIVAAVLWKIKQRYDRYRRRQRLFVEMEQMASRPFGSVLVEMERLPESSSKEATGSHSQLPPSSSSTSSAILSSSEITSTAVTAAADDVTTAAVAAAASTVRKRKKKYRPSPIALEPCEGNRAAVLSLIVRLPTAGKRYAPPGYTGIAVASSLVTLGNPRKASTDVNARAVDDPKRAGKARKGHGSHAQPADI